ncbi:glycoside hydrolase family 172 protein [Polaribacter sp. Asnod1-A03]|uniref:glycoside hydrolase family 172 protein n=1 Tax=Polaribacter sp. Asnod1-A03 TaxID=3160581 RepID=UPI00386AC491
MIDRDKQSRYPKIDFRLKQESSYNRVSVSIKDSITWFENHDFNSNDKDKNFIRIEENKNQKEWVLMDHKGPGAIVRTWMPFLNAKKPDTDIQIKIYLDGNDQPILEGNMLTLLNGDGFFPYPFAHKSLRSAVSFFPIPYSKSCKITTTKRPFFYQFTYREYPEGTNIKTFSKDEFNSAKKLINNVGEKLLKPTNFSDGQSINLNTTLSASTEKTIELPKGETAIKNLSLKLGSYQNDEIMRTTIIKIKFDGKETVWCPIGDFFGSGIGLNPYQNWHNTVAQDGTLTCRWVMPYQTSASISIENLSKTPINIELNTVVDDYTWNEQSMYFNAAWRGQYPVSTRPFSDWNFVKLKGRGVYIGDALTIMNPVEKWWGEGDEKIWIDGEDFPSIFGTGTEDYYGYSWGGISTDFYEHPFHAQPRSNVYNKLNRKGSNTERNTKGFSTEVRTRVLDVMPFSSSLNFDMEIWSWSDCDMGYGASVMWYGGSNTTSNRSPNNKEALNVPKIENTTTK